MRRVVLVRPRGPRNVGAALRAAANFGPVELVAVDPVRPSLLVHPEFEQMAHGVPGWRERCRVVADLATALADCTWSIGFTGRTPDHREVHDWRALRAGAARRGADAEERLALVFGNEIYGLAEEDLALVNELARLPTSAEHGSINLATCAAIVLWDTFAPEAEDAGCDRTNPIDGRARAFLIAHVRETLGDAARSALAREQIEEAIGRMFARSTIETRDARAWHAVMRAMGNGKTPVDYGIGGDVGG